MSEVVERTGMLQPVAAGSTFWGDLISQRLGELNAHPPPWDDVAEGHFHFSDDDPCTLVYRILRWTPEALVGASISIMDETIADGRYGDLLVSSDRSTERGRALRSALTEAGDPALTRRVARMRLAARARLRVSPGA